MQSSTAELLSDIKPINEPIIGRKQQIPIDSDNREIIAYLAFMQSITILCTCGLFSGARMWSVPEQFPRPPIRECVHIMNICIYIKSNCTHKLIHRIGSWRDDWSNGLADKAGGGDVLPRMMKREGSSGFFNWSHGDIKTEVEEGQYFLMERRETSCGDNQVSRDSWDLSDIKKEVQLEEEDIFGIKEDLNKTIFDCVKEDLSTFNSTFEVATQSSQPLPPVAVYYSQALTPINPYRTKSHRNKTKDKKMTERSNANENYYSKKFRPIACSTPKSQAPMLTMLETQLSQRIPKIEPMGQLDQSEDLCFLKLPVVNGSDSNLQKVIEEDVREVKAEPVVELAETELIDPTGFLPSSWPAEQAPVDIDSLEDTLKMVEEQKEVEEKDQFNFHALEMSNSGEDRFLNCENDLIEFDPIYLIPHVLVTSYKDTSNDDLFGGKSQVRSKKFEERLEAKRNIFLGKIQVIIFNCIKSIMGTGEIDPQILSFKRCVDTRGSQMETR